jgi:hypothetical protein
MNSTRLLMQFCVNWTVAVTLAEEQAGVEQWLREATACGGLVSALDRGDMTSALLQFNINLIVDVLHKCSGERIERKRRKAKMECEEENTTGAEWMHWWLGHAVQWKKGN